MAITNLNEYYSSKGQALPSVSQRAGLASQAGISNYTGTAQQNAILLKSLTGSTPATTVDTTKISTTSPTPAPVIPVGVVTSPQNQMQLPTPQVTGLSEQVTARSGTFLQQPAINSLSDIEQANTVAQQNSQLANQQANDKTLDLITQIENLPNQLNQQYKIQDLNTDAMTTKSKYDSIQLAYRRQKESATTNPALSAEQKDARLSEISRKESSELADVAIDYNLKAGLLSNAKELMNDQIKLTLEPLKLRIDYYKGLKEDYKEILNQTQKLQIDKIVRDEDRLYKEKEKALDLKNQMKLLDYKAQIDQRTVENKASGLGVNPKILATEQFKKAQSAQKVINTLNKTLETVKKYGNKENLNATGRGELDTLKLQLASEISTALEQGVIQPGEMDNFQKIAGQLNKSFFIRNKKTVGSLESLKSSMSSQINSQKAALYGAYGLDSGTVDSLLGVSSEFIPNNDPLQLLDITETVTTDTLGLFN